MHTKYVLYSDAMMREVTMSPYHRNRWSLLEEERKVNRLLRDDPENDKLNDRLQQVRRLQP